MKICAFLLFNIAVLCCISSKIWAQQVNIVIDSSVIPFIVDANEPCIAIDPKNPLNIVAGSNINNAYSSTDGGYTWKKRKINSSLGVWGDPVIVVDTNSSFYYFHLSNNPLYSSWARLDKIVCQRMDDISTSLWVDGGYAGLTDTPKIEDKPWAVVDRQTNVLYLTWTRFDKYHGSNAEDSSIILFSRSFDKGYTWSQAKRLNKVGGDCKDEDSTVEGAVPCIGPNGEIFVAWAAKNAIIFDRSDDGGDSWLDNDIFVTSVPGGWDYNIPGLNRCNGLPFTACDISNSAYNGTIYINWTDQRNGINNTDVWICKSRDNGDTWSAPIKVNDDTGSKQQFLSSMSVDPVTGYVYVLFYDRRNYSDSLLTDVYLAVSKDGAHTFQNHKISNEPFSPQSTYFFGDYTYVAAYNNIVRPIWGSQNAVKPNKKMQKVMTAIIDSTITGKTISVLPKTPYNLQVYPNPFGEYTSISFELPEQEAVSLYITDVMGRNIEILRYNELMREGRHIELFKTSQSNLISGVYFLCFRTPNYYKTVKIILAK